MEQQDLQQRLLIALVLSFIVFIVFSYIFPPEKPVTTQQAQTTQAQNATPSPQQSTSNAPQTPQAMTQNSVTQPQRLSAPAPQSVHNTLATITSDKFILSIDNFGRIAQMELLEDKYKTEDGKRLKILGVEKVKPLEVRFSDTVINEEAFKTPYTNTGAATIDVTSNSGVITLEQKLSDMTVVKSITFHPNGQYTVDISTSKPTPYFVTPGYRPIADQSMYMLVRGALIKQADDVIETIEDGDAKGNESYKNAKILSSFDRYYASLFYDFNNGMNVSVLTVGDDDPLTFIHGMDHMTINGYIGPKYNDTLKAIHPELTDAIEFGWFTFLAKPFFAVLLWINAYVGNWGWSIILFTILVKTVLFPLSYKGMMSMQRLKDLAPKMKEIKTKYGKDPAKMNQQMMELYKKEGANPMGGCLPMLLQIPVFFALYRVLLNADELQGAEWILWIHDLAVMDPYYILPILMAASMWFQQKITPTNFTDPMQEQIFKWLPVLMGIFFIWFPAGLVLYWFINNLFTIVQQYYINTMYAKKKEAAIAAKK